MSKPKYPKYQDYVIKNGKLVGEFEQIYQDYEDPWHQSKEEWASEKWGQSRRDSDPIF